MTGPAAAARVHVIGAGLAGLSAAVALADRGMTVVLSEAARQAGGRCRSYRDSVLDMVIDNGNHLVLSGNPAVGRYLKAIGAQDRLTGPLSAEFPFLDRGSGRRWTLRPNDGRVPWWVLSASRRVPGTRLADYLPLLALTRPHPGRRIDEVVSCHGVAWEKLLRPLLVSILNTRPEEASADLAGAVFRETLTQGGRQTWPRIATPSIAAAFVDPALGRLREDGVEIRLGRPLRAVTVAGDRLAALTFDDGEERLGPLDKVVLAVPPWTAQALLPQMTVPDDFRAIVNAHFRTASPANARLMVGVIGGTAEWVFAFPDRLSVTVSAADRLLDMDNQTLTDLLWRDVAAVHDLSGPAPPCRIVKEKRATFAATPAQEARRPASRTAWANAFLAGDWIATGLPATIEGALRSGEKAAALAMASR
ncbi:hydroxysqualene dehydroxylase HpnE [Enhydrobacter sp.]|jgi:squalene-associated FAD-dependent desaturase|uniref:hydroxysqualene dehydroxylase HpnE n=1 Tax=Enhydrobacter sp. TaxID=1894999 RepID=UPI0026035786|nr:hydroxysqualene dehydroxylase HpnE [Enhydrobacter sp.]WIM10239.1 MAG: Squalene-associated FAD-dependent desaturase, HpnE [Enhydrobacter sp.]